MKRRTFPVLLAVLLALASCKTSGDAATAKEVRKETREHRKSPIVLTAKDGSHYFNLRENGFFDYFGKALGVVKAELYAGTYERKGDSLMLAFHNNFQPQDLVNKGFIDHAANQIVLVSKEPGQDRRMGIILNNLR